MKILFKGPFLEGKTGYAILGRQLALALDSLGVDLYCLHTGALFRKEIQSDNPRLDSLIKRTLNTPGLNPDVAINLGVPLTLATHFIHGKKRICYTFWEASKLPDTWTENFNIFDQVWTPSKWGRQMFIDSGVKEELIRIVPGGVDRRLFNPYVKPFESIKRRKTFKFLCLGKWERRKGQEELLRAFREEFGDNQYVELLLQTQNIFIQDFSINLELRKLGYAKEELKNVRFLRGFLPYEELPRLYASVDCFVIPTRGEGWCLPLIEAMSSGLPSIATGCTAQLDYMTPENSYILRHKGLVDAIEPRWDIFFKGTKWYEPDYNHLRELMRYVYEHKEEASKVGIRASQDMKKWSWESAAHIALKNIEEIG